MENRREPLGRAFIERTGGWRTIYAARRITRGTRKGWFEVSYIGMTSQVVTYRKDFVRSYRTLQGDVIDG